MPIRLLPPVVVNQIAAGEVVERPASVVKELIDNALDAGATRIEVLVEAGGVASIEVIDDGCGIPMDELPLAIASHATSKVCTLGDLEHIATMGFRGEALASIGSVARLSIRSRPSGEDAGGEIIVDHGETAEPRPAACPPGTRVRIDGLFGRVPARRKFLKSAQAETTRIRRVVRDLAAANPETHFSLASGARVLLDLPPAAPEARVAAILGADIAGRMLPISAAAEGVAISGLVGRPDVARPTAQHQILCLNGRPIVDKSLRHAIKEAYRGLIEPGRHPTVAVFLSIPPDRVDVNVHPAKTEVRLRDDRLVFSTLRRCIESALQAADIVPAVTIPDASPAKSAAPPALFGRSAAGGAPGFSPVAARAAVGPVGERDEGAPVSIVQAARPAIQVHRMFLVTEDAEGVLIIDQHALHERVMFERLFDRISEAKLPSQRLLVPELVDVSAETIEAMEAIGTMLDRLGFDLAASGPGTVAVHAVPSLLAERRVSIGSFVADLLDRAAELRDAADEETALRDVLDMMACKAAIKAGDPLNERELADLLSMREQVERSSNCPHGRPTTVRLSIEELEKRFGRR
ncbi:MAG: DNA mismatch repair endonuclease MutL [Phycisphaerales bacterium]|jgi:DNA mismatch repair protein MutL|nr:DNA mismatch repair endonuclease MutL [Phycisphaerales bacterium]